MFKRIFPIVLDYEGGYVYHPNDKGGATNKGVTQDTYDAYRDKLGVHRRDVREILFQEAEQIYSDYWRAASCDKISTSHPLTAAVHFDCAINSGPRQAARILQRAVEAKPVDGIIGNVTLTATFKTDDLSTANKCIELRQEFFLDIVTRDRTQFVFLRGWLRRLNHLRKLTYEWSRDSKQSNASSSPA